MGKGRVRVKPKIPQLPHRIHVLALRDGKTLLLPARAAATQRNARRGPACRRADCMPAAPDPAGHLLLSVYFGPHYASLRSSIHHEFLIPKPYSSMPACRAGRRRASARWCAATARCCCRCFLGRTTRACAAASTSCTRSSSPLWCARGGALCLCKGSPQAVAETLMQCLHGSAPCQIVAPPEQSSTYPRRSVVGSATQGPCLAASG